MWPMAICTVLRLSLFRAQKPFLVALLISSYVVRGASTIVTCSVNQALFASLPFLETTRYSRADVL